MLQEKRHNKDLSMEVQYGALSLSKSLELLGDFFAPGIATTFLHNLDTNYCKHIAGQSEEIYNEKLDHFDISVIKRLLHPYDLPNYNTNESAVYEFFKQQWKSYGTLDVKASCCYRFITREGTYRKVLQQSKPYSFSDDLVKIKQILITHIDVTHLPFIVDYKVTYTGQEINNIYSQYKGRPMRLLEMRQDFTEQEFKIITRLLEGLTRDEIADKLIISRHTLNTHIKNALTKSGSSNITHLVSRCMAECLV